MRNKKRWLLTYYALRIKKTMHHGRIMVPSASLTLPHDQLERAGSVIGYFAASSSSISMPKSRLAVSPHIPIADFRRSRKHLFQ